MKKKEKMIQRPKHRIDSRMKTSLLEISENENDAPWRRSAPRMAKRINRYHTAIKITVISINKNVEEEKYTLMENCANDAPDEGISINIDALRRSDEQR